MAQNIISPNKLVGRYVLHTSE